jgi:hypothetical protein
MEGQGGKLWRSDYDHGDYDRGDGAKRAQNPPRHFPPPRDCRSWYWGVPPGHQLRLSAAELVAAQVYGAVIYWRGLGNADDI